MEPIIIGGRDFSLMRANHDERTNSIILTSSGTIEYYDDKGKNESTYFCPSTEPVVACERLDRSLYLCNESGRLLQWSLDQRDWLCYNQLFLEPTEKVVTVKVISEVSFVYVVSLGDLEVIYFCTMPSLREPPTHRSKIDVLTNSNLKSLDVGCVPEKYVAYINGKFLRVKAVPQIQKKQQHIQTGADFTCIRAHPNKSILVAGDAIGRILVYIGDLFNRKINRTELHWHSMEVNDLCFSNEGSMLYSVGAEAGCVACWNLGVNSLGKQPHIIARLGMPLRNITYEASGRLILSNVDNETLVLAANKDDIHCSVKALSQSQVNTLKGRPFGLIWDPNDDSVVTTSNLGTLQFFSPHSREPLYKKDFLENNILSFEADREVSQSAITRAAISLDGEWLAIYQTRHDGFSLPEIKLRIWRRKSQGKWKWVQTIERPHKTVEINDLQFSANSKLLLSTADDETFQIWYKIGDDQEDIQTYARGYNGKTVGSKPTRACFSQDSSLVALGTRFSSILLWSIESEQRLNYMTQLGLDMNNKDPGDIIGISFGYNECSGLLCEVRTKAVKVWSILAAEYTLVSTEGVNTAVAFDTCKQNSNYFALINDRSQLSLFSFLSPAPLITVAYEGLVIGMCFVEKQIISSQHTTPEEDLLRRLCIFNNRQELSALTDKLSIESLKSKYNTSKVSNLDIAELGRYFQENQIEKQDAIEVSSLRIDMTTRKNETNRVLNQLFTQVPSHLLPVMKDLGPLVLSKLVPQKG